MLVFRPLRPGSDEIGELESPRRRTALCNESGIAADRFPHDFPLFQVLTDVVEIEIDGRRIATRGPFFGWRVERNVGF